ncbi:AMP-binding protein [Runella sp.]|jgi:O-succinylbenzoic acid--CoA ligase|uniref:AMP-binding protein n=1 Tax=Runella sp. TaxID=1960881 RepID=UPI002605BCBF|nr:AMP-binding protein [Runella sp.]
MYYEIIPDKILQTPAPANPYFWQAWEFCQLYATGKKEFLLHTSGSTGEPKPILLTRAQMQASAWVTQKALHLKSGRRALVCLNIAYIAGTMMLVRGMELGLTMYVVAPSSQPFAELTDDLSIDFTAVVPLQLKTLLETGQHDRLNSLNVLIVGGAPVNSSLLTQIQQLSVPVFSTYGMTETVSHIALRKLNGLDASESYTLLDGVEADTDERDCLRLRGAVTNHEWIQTNDVVIFKDATHFQIMGRADNIINSGGVKIQLEKVERAIEQIWNRSERFFVWWKPDERLGQKLILVTENTQITDKENLNKELQKLLNPYEIPKEVYTVKKFVETATGKVDKRRTFEENS